MMSRNLELLFWLAGLLLLCGLHLWRHPQALYFRRALRWLRKNPAPVLLLAASYTVLNGLSVWPGDFSNADSALSSRLPRYAIWLASLENGLKDFALLFHHTIAPPPVLFNPWVGAVIQSLVAAVSQLWFCRLLINSQSPFTEDWLSLRQTLALWPSILLLAALYLPWWFLQRPQAEGSSDLLRRLLLPEYLLLLAPLPLMLALCQGNFSRAGGYSLQAFMRHGVALATIALGAIPLLAFLDYSLRVSHHALTGGAAPFRVVMASLAGAVLHLWLYVTAALVMLPGSIPSSRPA